jgi:hypothetical protein
MQILLRVRDQHAPARKKIDPESIVYIQKLYSTYNETSQHKIQSQKIMTRALQHKHTATLTS